MQKPFKTFVFALLWHWWALMSCAAFTMLGIYIAQSGKSNAWLVSASAVLAVAFFVVAAYRTWKPEHEKRCQLERELNAEADMRGTIYIRSSDSGQQPGVRILFSCACANHGRKPCQISKLIFNVRRESGRTFRMIFPFLEPSVRTVAHGEQFIFDGHYPIPDLTLEELPHTTITVGLIDSLGKEYWDNIKTVAWSL